MHAHQQSHLYPCQLVCAKTLTSSVDKFMFYSPINSYSTTYDLLMKQCDFVDHQGLQFSRISTIQLGQNQKCAVFNNSQTINFVGDQTKTIEPIRVNSQEEIVSDIISLPNNFTHSLQETNNSYSIAYLSSRCQQSEDSMYLNIKGFKKRQFFEKQKENRLNPQSDHFIETEEDQCASKNTSQRNEYNSASSTEIKLPFLTKSRPYPSQSFQIKSNKLINTSDNTLTFFQKQSSILYTYEPEYETIANTISCSHGQKNQLVTEYQGNKISLLSQNLMINSHCNSVVKLIDKRVGRVVHMRNFVEEMAMIVERPSTQSQQNVIKFWNQQKTCTIDEPTISTSQFLINLKSQIYQVDLRNNRLIKQDSVFKFDSPEQLTNYQIVQKDNEKFIAFTTQSHSNFKAYVVQESKQNKFIF